MLDSASVEPEPEPKRFSTLTSSICGTL